MLFPIIPSRAAKVFGASVDLTGTQSFIEIGLTATFVVKIPAAAIIKTGTSVRLTLKAGNQNTIISNVTISNAATSGQAWNSAATPTAVLYNGGASWTLSGPYGTEFVSDPTTFTVTGSSALLIACNVTATSMAVYNQTAITTPSVVTYYKGSVSEAGSASRGASYISFGSQVFAFDKLEAA